MIHADLVNIASGAHVGVAGLAVVGLLKYGLWSSEYKDWQTNSRKALRRVRGLLAVELCQRLSPLVDGVGKVVVSEILDAHGTYCEKEVDATKSEDFRNALFDAFFDFVERNAGEMAKYVYLLKIHNRATFWRKALTWAVFAMVVLQAVLLSMLLIDRFGLVTASDWLVCWSILPTVLSVGTCFLCLGLTVHYHNKGSLYFVEEVEPQR